MRRMIRFPTSRLIFLYPEYIISFVNVYMTFKSNNYPVGKLSAFFYLIDPVVSVQYITFKFSLTR